MSTKNDTSDFCGADLPQGVEPAVALHLPLRVFENTNDPNEKVVQGHWDLPEGSWLTLEGTELGFVQSTSGVVTLVPCSADLQYRVCPSTDPIDLSVGKEFDIDPSYARGIRFEFPPDTPFTVAIAAKVAPCSVVIEAKVIEGNENAYKVISGERSWNYKNTQIPELECGIFRCP